MPRRYALTPWSTVSPSDLEPQGTPEYVRELASERQLGLFVVGTYGAVLGLMAVRCERRGALEHPLTMHIADTVIRIEPDLEPAQRNPMRVDDVPCSGDPGDEN